MAEHRPAALPVDGHVHTQWSWDAPTGSMERSCARAVELGLPGIAFTEHVDHTVWRVDVDDLDDGHFLRSVASDGVLTPPPFDAESYLAEIERCRHLFPGLRILSGMELGEPHWHAAAVDGVLGAGRFDRLLGSLHCLPDGDGFAEPPGLFRHRPAAGILREYLAEITHLATGSDAFAVVAHIDYPIRHWPEREAGAFDVGEFEEEFRAALRTIAGTGRALEINTVRPLDAAIVRWWHEEGGQAVTFGSDAHEPDRIARAFAEAADLAAACGFRPAADPYDFWGR